MSISRRLGRDTLERDVNRLKSFTADLSKFTMTDPFVTRNIQPEATDLYDIGTSSLYYQEIWALAFQIGDGPADYQGVIFGSGAVNRPQLEITTSTPTPSAASNYAFMSLIAPGPSGSSGEDARVYISGGDDNGVDIPYIEFQAGSDDVILQEGLGLLVEQELRLKELSADPTAPGEGRMVIWQSDGTGAGDDGDIMVSIRAGGTTKTTTLIDFSAI